MDSEKNMTIKCLPGWVLLEPEKDENTTASGIMLPDSSQDVPMRGKVLSVGKHEGKIEWHFESYQDFLTVFPAVEVEATVLYKKYSGQTIKSEGKELKLVEFKDLLAVIE